MKITGKMPYCVNGEWKQSQTKKYMPVTDSSTGELIAEVPCCTLDEVEAAIQAAHQAFPAWSDTPVAKRTQIMFKYRELLDAHLEELAVLVAKELGKNLEEARGDVLKAIEVVELACGMPSLMKGESLMNVSGGHDTVMYREPLGVFAGIAPFNFPAMIPYGWMIPLCITAGNTFVLKAASYTPLTSYRMLELLMEAGLPKGVVNIVTCSRNEAELLLTHPHVKGVSFVGSTGIGKHVYTTAAAHGKRVQAQCEAKNHALVLADAPLERVAAGIINSGFGCAGMRCMALPVVCVEESVADEFVEHLVKLARNMKVGCAYKPETDLGPLVTAEHKKFVTDWIAKGISEGAKLILDGRDVCVAGYEGGFFVGPTIFDHVKPGMTLGESEVFGPVVAIKRVKDFEEGLKIMNDSPFANGSAIFTQSGHYAREFAKRTHGGMVGVNVGIPVPMSAFPFSGHKDSFFGDLHVNGRDGVAFFTEAKCVTSRWFDEEEKKKTKVDTWEGTTNRS
ncbi:MAG TPA: CoA-acylating methylmalonate-semialdehyde dehydrogenase [Patescibacteria group bacterium]|nr:CoA-acylating methylmalonate-semialdehyde dehydrogenase [Patescibacteria group bacterium]